MMQNKQRDKQLQQTNATNVKYSGSKADKEDIGKWRLTSVIQMSGRENCSGKERKFQKSTGNPAEIVENYKWMNYSTPIGHTKAKQLSRGLCKNIKWKRKLCYSVHNKSDATIWRSNVHICCSGGRTHLLGICPTRCTYQWPGAHTKVCRHHQEMPPNWRRNKKPR